MFNATSVFKVIGLTIEEAQAKYPKNVFRTMRADGEDLVGTCDYRTNRVNVSVANDVIDEVLNIG